VKNLITPRTLYWIWLNQMQIHTSANHENPTLEPNKWINDPLQNFPCDIIYARGVWTVSSSHNSTVSNCWWYCHWCDKMAQQVQHH